MNVLIIGGSSDVGKSIGKYLLSKDYNVIITYNNHIDNTYGIEFIHCDVRDEFEIEDTIKYVISKYGSIDILINMSAISMDNNFLDKTKEEFMNVLEINLVGMFLCNKVYSKYVNTGLIINISSTDGIDTNSGYSIDYSASKAGVINMTKSIALATSNTLVCVCPNWIDSDSTRKMDSEYLKMELERVRQSRLITLDEISKSIYDIINMKLDSGSIIRIDIRDDRLWIEKI